MANQTERAVVHLVCVLAPLLLAGASAAASGREFTFRDAEFLPQPQGYAAAMRFVAERLPAGLPLADARARVERAGMNCSARAQAIVTCRYSIPVHADGGVIGDNTWTLRFVPDGRARLASAALHYDRGGVEN